MKKLLKTGLIAAIGATCFITTNVVAREAAMNEKHAAAATEYRKAFFNLYAVTWRR